MATTHMTDQKEHPLKNPWVWLIIGIMGAAIIVNTVLITLAFTSPPGLVVENYYEKGKGYFYDQAKSAAAQERLGWQMNLDLPKAPIINTGESYLVRLLDREGLPIEGGHGEFAAYRPAENGHDMFLPLRDLGAGYYGAEVTFVKPGNWDLIVTVQKGEDKLDVAKRIYLND